MIHEVLPERLMMYVNQAHNIYIKTSLKSELGAIYKLRIQYLGFYAQKQLLLSARLSHRNSVRPSVCHTGGSVKNGAS